MIVSLKQINFSEILDLNEIEYSFSLKNGKNILKKLKLECYKSINTLPSPKEQTEESISIFYKINFF